MSDQAVYRRLRRVRSGHQKTVPIPTTVLAEAIEVEGDGPLVRHLGPDMVDAVQEAAKRDTGSPAPTRPRDNRPPKDQPKPPERTPRKQGAAA
ncbi:hypothetical protein BAY59_10970 [Prauserella coralliicola]|nr:hypothetical protein BAY59_10970 [Prauserella coralliicola]